MTGLYKFRTEKNMQACVHDLLCCFVNLQNLSPLYSRVIKHDKLNEMRKSTAVVILGNWEEKQEKSVSIGGLRATTNTNDRHCTVTFSICLFNHPFPLRVQILHNLPVVVYTHSQQQFVLLLLQFDCLLCEWRKSRLARPELSLRQVVLCGPRSRLRIVYFYTNYTVIKAVRCITYCYFSTCGPRTSPQ